MRFSTFEVDRCAVGQAAVQENSPRFQAPQTRVRKCERRAIAAGEADAERHSLGAAAS